MLTLRNYSVPRLAACRTLPRFPERREGRIARRNSNGLLDSRAERHARMAWEDARLYAVNRAATASVVTDGKPEGILELVMISALADHLASCPHCNRTSPWSGDRPADWITWATVNSRLRGYLAIAGQETSKPRTWKAKRAYEAKRRKDALMRNVADYVRTSQD